jgi:hypothetical protein
MVPSVIDSAPAPQYAAAVERARELVRAAVLEAAAKWSPEHIGEPEEDFPLFTIIRDVIFRPIGLAPAQPLPADRATFYVPRSDAFAEQAR